MTRERERQGGRPPRPRRRRWALGFAIAAAVGLAAYAGFGFVIAPPIAERVLAGRLAQRLGRRVEIAGVRVNPFTLSLTVERLRVFEADRRTVFASAEQIYANAELASLVRHALVLRALRVESPRLRVVRASDRPDGWNWSDLVGRRAASEDGEGGRPPRVSIRDVQVDDGAVVYEDLVRAQRHELVALDARVPQISTLPEDAGGVVAPALRARLDGALVRLAGHVRRVRGAFQGAAEVHVSDLALPRAVAEAWPALPFLVRSGVLSADLSWSFAGVRDGRGTSKLGGRVEIERLEIASDRRTPPLTLGTLAVALRRADVDIGGPEAAARCTLDVELAGDRGARGRIEGSFGVQPATAELRFHLRDVDLSPLSSQIGRHLHFVVAGGSLSAKGVVRLASDGRRRASPPRLQLAADVDVARFASVDPKQRAPLVTWRALRASGVAFSSAPTRLAVRQLAFDGLAVRLVHHADRTWNIPRGAASTAAGAKRPARRVSIADITVRGGSFSLVDEGVRPTFTAAVDDVLARVTGLSTRDGQLAKAEASGRPPGATAFAVSGGIGVKSGRFAADLAASLGGFPISRLSPYSAKYTSYLIAGGAMDLTTRCRITAGKLTLDNDAVITGARLGDKVEGGRSTKLPMPVVVSLLENRRGVIHLSVPVSGSFDDPQFHVGRAVGRALRNVVLKTIASPFTILGAVFGRGHGEDLSHVEFRAGSATLDGSAQQVVRSLAVALREKPELVFDIEGRADPDRDGAGRDLPALARRRAEAVRDALARAAPQAAPRLRLVAAKVDKGAGSRVQLELEGG